MFSDDIVQILTSGRSLQENMPTYQTTSPVKKKQKPKQSKQSVETHLSFRFSFSTHFKNFKFKNLEGANIYTHCYNLRRIYNSLIACFLVKKSFSPFTLPRNKINT